MASLFIGFFPTPGMGFRHHPRPGHPTRGEPAIDTLPSQKASVVRNGRGCGARRSSGYRTLFDISAAGQYPTVGFARPGGLFAAPLGPGVASSTSR